MSEELTPEEAAARFKALTERYELGNNGVASEMDFGEGEGEATSLREFMQTGEKENFNVYDWVIPNFLEHKDKIIITGPSGRGKSTLCRQIALTAAAGRYPFDRPDSIHKARTFDPARVVLLDCENRPRQMWRGMETLLYRLQTQYGHEPMKEALNNLHIKVREEGIDLLQESNVDRLLSWLDRVQPQIVVLGPLYYLSSGDPNSEQVAFTVGRALRKITVEFNAAIILEAHSAKSTQGYPRTDPQGSNIWVKWPDIGRSIFPPDSNDPNFYELKKFRGDREVRSEMPNYLRLDWDSQLVKGAGVSLPWYIDFPDEDQL